MGCGLPHYFLPLLSPTHLTPSSPSLLLLHISYTISLQHFPFYPPTLSSSSPPSSFPSLFSLYIPCLSLILHLSHLPHHQSLPTSPSLSLFILSLPPLNHPSTPRHPLLCALSHAFLPSTPSPLLLFPFPPSPTSPILIFYRQKCQVS